MIVLKLRTWHSTKCFFNKKTTSGVGYRAGKLEIFCWQGIKNKIRVFIGLLQKINFELNQIAYVGNEMLSMTLRLLVLHSVLQDVHG